MLDNLSVFLLGLFIGVLISALFLIYNNNKPSKLGMKEELLEVIAIHSVFGLDEVSKVYDIFQSYDLLISAAAYCQRTGMYNLEVVCIFEKAKRDGLLLEDDIDPSGTDSIATAAIYKEDA
jgi:hypothetical protein